MLTMEYFHLKPCIVFLEKLNHDTLKYYMKQSSFKSGGNKSFNCFDSSRSLACKARNKIKPFNQDFVYFQDKSQPNKFVCKHCSKIFNKKNLYKEHVKSHNFISSQTLSDSKLNLKKCKKQKSHNSSETIATDNERVVEKTGNFGMGLYNQEKHLYRENEQDLSLPIEDVSIDKKNNFLPQILCIKNETDHSKLFDLHKNQSTNVIKNLLLNCYRCPNCPPEKNVKFKSEKLLLQHMDRHTYPYVCEICLKRFARKDSLVNHLRICANLPDLVEFPKQSLKSMVTTATIADKPAYIKCTECGEIFYEMPAYRRHFRRHTHPFECKLCGQRFARRMTLAEHFCDPTLYRCVLCTRSQSKSPAAHSQTQTFPTLIQLEEHLADPGLNGGHNLPPTQLCTDCGRKFRLEASVEEHVCHIRLQQTFIHQENSFTTYDKRKVSDHDNRLMMISRGFTGIDINNNTEPNIETKHSTIAANILNYAENSNYESHDCLDATATITTTAIISKTNVSKLKVGNLDPFICEMCGQKFSSANTLKAHRVIHGERCFKCEICGRAFHRKDTLKVHYRVHEDDAAAVISESGTRFLTTELDKFSKQNESPNITSAPIIDSAVDVPQIYKYAKRNEYQRHSCPICGKVVKSKHSLDTHLKLHRPQHEEKVHACHVCPKTFLQKGNLRKHLLTHAQQRFSCPICNKIFSSKEYCAHHIREHTEEKKHGCPECGKRFLLRHRMLDHFTRSHTFTAYPCPFCEMKIKMRHSLKRHFRRKHPKLNHIWEMPGYAESFTPVSSNLSNNPVPLSSPMVSRFNNIAVGVKGDTTLTNNNNNPNIPFLFAKRNECDSSVTTSVKYYVSSPSAATTTTILSRPQNEIDKICSNDNNHQELSDEKLKHLVNFDISAASSTSLLKGISNGVGGGNYLGDNYGGYYSLPPDYQLVNLNNNNSIINNGQQTSYPSYNNNNNNDDEKHCGYLFLTKISTAAAANQNQQNLIPADLLNQCCLSSNDNNNTNNNLRQVKKEVMNNDGIENCYVIGNGNVSREQELLGEEEEDEEDPVTLTLNLNEFLQIDHNGGPVFKTQDQTTTPPCFFTSIPNIDGMLVLDTNTFLPPPAPPEESVRQSFLTNNQNNLTPFSSTCLNSYNNILTPNNTNITTINNNNNNNDDMRFSLNTADSQVAAAAAISSTMYQQQQLFDLVIETTEMNRMNDI